MDNTNMVVCPVCTLYLRPGMTLENHLSSHPKQKVIEALIRATQDAGPPHGGKPVIELVPSSSEQQTTTFSQTNSAAVENCWSNGAPVNQQQPTNHSFIYQQFMSSSGTQPLINMNPMTQQFVAIPAVFNPQMFCPPYIFQQQQQVQIVAAGTNLPFIPRQPTDLFAPTTTGAMCTSVTDMTTLRVDSGQPDIGPSPKSSTIASMSEKSVIVSCGEKSEPVSVLTGDEEEPTTDTVVILNGFTQPATIPSVIYSRERSLSPHSGSLSPPLASDDKSTSDTYDTKLVDKMQRPISPLKELEIKFVACTSNMEDAELHDTRATTATEDLNKACQTMQTIVYKDMDPETVDIMTEGKCNEAALDTTDRKPPPHIDLTANENANFDDSENVALEPYQTKEIVLNSEKCVNHSNNDVHNVHNNITNNVTILEMVDINYILPSDLIQNGQSIVSKVSDSECMMSDENHVPVLLSLGKCEVDDKLEELSRDSLNIRADERMPPRGELSEQESNGASEPGWSSGAKLYQEGSSAMGMSLGASYDLLARESWEGSDYSDAELPLLQSRVPPAVQYNPEADVDEVLVVERETPPLRFACTTCGVSFRCPKERRVHQASEHEPKPNHTDLDELNVEIKPDIKVEVKLEESKDNFLCYTCGEMLSSQRELSVHNRKVHNIRPVTQHHICKTCCQTFPSEVKFSEHLKVHPLECQICGKHFYRNANLRLHQKRHLGVRPHKCDLCTKAFLTKQKLTEHHNVHTGNAPIKCNMCEETFRRYSNLVQHRNRHHLNVKKKVKDYVCPCGEVFHSKNKFNWHKEIHEPKPKSCRYCHEKFVHMSSLTRHIRRAHNQRYVPEKQRESENVECHVCNGIYLKSSLEAHMNTHSGKKMHTCNICNKDFTTKWNLKLHKWTHATATSKPFKCELCQNAFVRHSDYVAHSNSHKSVRPYTCNYCGSRFIRKYNCLRHVREHEESKAYICSVCNKSFHRSYYLKEHLRVHNGVRPFACNICGKTSTTKSNHNKHMKIHHAREPISTEG